MRYYLIEAITRDGEFEYLNRMVFERKRKISIEQAGKIAVEWFGFKGSYQIVELDSLQELTENEYNVLKRFL